ncbi:TPA: zinc-finger domain-containing protein, partial [Neisseria meningitidis]
MDNLNLQEISVLPENLPLYCSGPDNEQWNGHPRVFLPLCEGESGSVAC